jgi:hypothetical protein
MGLAARGPADTEGASLCAHGKHKIIVLPPKTATDFESQKSPRRRPILLAAF